MASRIAGWERLLSQLSALDGKAGSFGGSNYLKQLNLGQGVFGAFFDLGLSLRASNTTVKNSSSDIINPVCQAVKQHQHWLIDFVSIFGSSEVDLEGSVPARDICKVRSGVQFLLDSFSGISSDFDLVLKKLKDDGDIKQFDANLKIWIERGHRDDLRPQDIVSTVPSDHWWWF